MTMYNIHPIVNFGLVEQRGRELRRIAGQTRPHREPVGRRVRGRRGT